MKTRHHDTQRVIFKMAQAAAAPSLTVEQARVAIAEGLAAFEEAGNGLVAAFGAEGALDRMYTLPFGEMPGHAFMGLAVVDTFQHAWDAAKATGQDTDLAPELASALLEQSRASIQESFRGPDGQAPFGPEQSAPAGASAADQLAAFLGRDV